ncbi:MAG: hypothetical protein J2P37_01680 [Ktedonobacteraceae bacterium]|nr:hypothetical protein [Ktedonobacteraceae bacterium]MBO0790607.1 hypothetical protein [Ktedonobacteraceae bacterium]
MNTFVTTAIIGTGQQNQPDIRTGTAVDALTPTGEIERQLLLTAGALAAYRMAGSVPQPAESTTEPAAAEQLPTCSPEAARQIEQCLLNTSSDLLAQAYTLLQQARLRLPHSLLPLALDNARQHKVLRALLIPALGERGFWLSRHNPEWSWVAHFLTDQSEELPADAEEIWQEGTLGQRCEILRRLRAIDPARARDWLNTILKQEKAEARRDLLATFASGLSIDDEPLLEQLLTDRSESVRHQAITLLAQIPGSGLSQRMLERANALLRYEKKLAKKGQVKVSLPTTVPVEWQRDGISAQPGDNAIAQPQKEQYHNALLRQILDYIDPAHWEAHFSVTPDELVNAQKNGTYAEAILTAWSEAALLFNRHDWMAPLFDWWYAKESKHYYYSSADTKSLTLLKHMPQSEAETKVLQMLTNLSTNWSNQPIAALDALPRPWSAQFADATFKLCREFVQTTKDSDNRWYTWGHFLDLAGAATPTSSLETASTGWTVPERLGDQYKQNVTSLLETLQIRKTLLEEIQ